MSLSFTQEQEEMRHLVRRFLEQKSDSQAVRALMATQDNRDLGVWTQMAAQLGLQGIAIPEEFGGSGLGTVELGIVMEEMGRTLLVAPYFSTVVLAAQTLVASDDQTAKGRWLALIADGSLTATLAFAEEAGDWDLGGLSTRAEERDGGWVLTGAKHFVIDGHTSGLLLVVARAADGVGVFAVESGAAGLERTQVETLDLTRDLATVKLDAVRAVRVGSDHDATPWLTTVWDRVLAAVAAEQIGGAAKCLETAVAYAKVREQFGRPIGSFQAIKHKCADMLVEVESGRSAVYHATAAVAESGVEASIAAALAAAHCSVTYTRTAKENIQIHGGIGYTWEHDAHLFLRRAKSSEVLLGAPRVQRARLAGLVGI